MVEDYSADVLAMRGGGLELAQFGPLGYVFASTKAKAEPILLRGLPRRPPAHRGWIWVPKDSPLRTVGDLRGEGLALGEVGSTSGDALPRDGLEQVGAVRVTACARVRPTLV